MKTIILHIGHTKTGSSYIQSSLSLSGDSLKKEGVVYPWHKNFNSARLGNMTWGNLKTAKLVTTVKKMSKKLKNNQRLLFSNEIFFEEFFNHIDSFKLIRSAGFSIKIVLYIRNPYEHAQSHYSQLVKGAGHTGSFSEYLMKYDTPMHVKRILEMEGDAFDEIKIINYSKHRGRLLETFAESIEVTQQALVVPHKEIVNRSMTESELELQLIFNKHYRNGKANTIGINLCNELPFILSEGVAVQKDVVEKFLETINLEVEKVNSLICPSERYVYDNISEINCPTYDKSEGNLTFSKEQIEVIVSSLKFLKKPKNKCTYQNFKKLLANKFFHK